MYLEAITMPLWRYTWILKSREIGDTDESYDRASFGMHLEAMI
jgi:hypothetical protein